MSLAQQNFRQTPVAAASATVLSMPALKAQPSEAADGHANEVADFLSPRLSKRKKSGYDEPTAFKVLVGSRMREVREQAGVTLTEAAHAMGYVQPVQLSNMENGQRPPTLRVLLMYAAAFGSTVDYLCGLTSDAEADPATVIQRRLAAEVSEELRQVLAKVAATSVDLARDVRPVLARALRLAQASMEARRALATVRALNPSFDDDLRGGAGLVAKLESSAELAAELLEATTGLQAKARDGLVGAALKQASLDEGVSLAAVRAMLSSSDPVSPSADASRVAALMNDAGEGECDRASDGEA
jgi:transcriptional regulator with XRE-family HTH domain